MKVLILTILFLNLVFSFSYAECPVKETDLGRALLAYFKDVELDNYGEPESIKVIEPHRMFTNKQDWQDDTGTVIVIIDSYGNELFWDEVNRYQPINNITIDNPACVNKSYPEFWKHFTFWNKIE